MDPFYIGDEGVKKFLSILLSLCTVFLFVGCTNSNEVIHSKESMETNVKETDIDNSNTNLESEEITMTQIAVNWQDKQVVYELNDCPIANSLLKQLPLSVEIENYSNNEKIFYPPEKLDTTDSPLAKGGAGTLAYYEPWGDVVFFYGDYRENSGLFELGKVVSGEEWIHEMTGTIAMEVVHR